MTARSNEEAKALLTGLILFVVTHEPPQRRTLATVRELVTLAPDAFADLMERMQDSTAANGLVARAANRHCGKSDREAAGVLSSAQRHTHFLDSPRMAAVTARSDFAFADLKAQTATVFLVLPPDRLDAYSRWLRLLVAQAITDMATSMTVAFSDRAPKRRSFKVRTIARKLSFSASSASTIATRRAGSEGTSSGRIGMPQSYRIRARFTIQINQITPPEAAVAPVAARPSSNRGHPPASRIARPSVERPRPGSAAR